jgi:P-type Ca2+ transporter type 2C
MSSRAGPHLSNPFTTDFRRSSLLSPGISSHGRSNSVSSNASAKSSFSSWTESPDTDVSRSDVGDQLVDIRELLRSTDSSKLESTGSPFAFTKSQLGKRLYDPKNLDLLRAMEGLGGLTIGLRTDIKKGLSPDEDILEGQITLENVWDAPPLGVASTCPRPSTVPDGTAPVIQQDRDRRVRSQQKIQNPKMFRDRRRIFGENILPRRPRKNIFQLMWLTLHDKTLVRLFLLN